MRVFLAIELTSSLRAAITGRLPEMRRAFDAVPGLRFLPAPNWHLTLRFLGETDSAMLTALGSTLEETLTIQPRFRLHFRGMGWLPSARRPRVLFAAVSDPPEPLGDLVDAVEASVVLHGWPGERRPFRPHVTLARRREAAPARSNPELTSFEGLDFGDMAVEWVTMFESRLSSKGARYIALRRFALRPNGE